MIFNQENNGESRQITIIGGHGNMGQFFTRELSAVGHQVCAFGNQDWSVAEKLLGEADLVLISVPIEKTVEIIKRAAKYMKPSAAIADITSVKVKPVEAMLEHHQGAVMGLHPMFGPKVESFASQIIVVCSGRNHREFQWLLDFFKAKGSKLVESTPEEHDKTMLTTQAIRHFARFSLGVFFAEENIDVRRSLSMASPTYKQEIDILKRLFSQSSHLCADIILATEERCEAIVSLAETYSRLAKIVATKDREALIREFESTQNYFNQAVVCKEDEQDMINDTLVSNSLEKQLSIHHISSEDSSKTTIGNY